MYHTVIVVPGQILPVYEEVVVLVQLPELAVDHVEVLVAEVLGDLKRFDMHFVSNILKLLHL